MSPTYEIFPADRRDCGRIVRHLRAEHAYAVRARTRDAHRELVRTFNASAVKYTCMLGGRPVAMFGVTGPVLSGEGYVWLVATAEAARFPKALYFEARRWLKHFVELWGALRATLLVEDQSSLRFARHLGFIPEGEPHEGALHVSTGGA